MIFEETIQKIISGQPYTDWSAWDDNMHRSFAEFGTFRCTNAHINQADIDRRFTEMKSWMERVSGSQQFNSAYMDTTTLYTINNLILDREKRIGALNPATLMDLNTFVNAVVLFDKVFYLENRFISPYSLNEALGNQPVFIQLPVYSLGQSFDNDELNSVSAYLRGLWYETDAGIVNLRQARDGVSYDSVSWEDAVAIKQSWRKLLAFEGRDDLWFDPRREMKNQLFHSDGPALLDNLLDVIRHTDNAAVGEHLSELGENFSDRLIEFLHSVIDECNYRSAFHLRVSSLLQVDYLPNCFRLPHASHFYKKIEITNRYLPTIKAIESEYKSLGEKIPQSHLQLPFFLAAVLGRISSLDDFFSELAHIRLQASDFRRHRGELDDALKNNDVNTANKLIEAMNQDAKKLQLKFPFAPLLAGAGAVVAAALGGITAPLWLLTIGLLTAGGGISPYYETLKKRFLNRKFWILTDLSDTAKASINIYPKICELWGLDKENTQQARNFVKQYSRIQSLN